jgi:uncharacterized protein (DUF58 family)
MNCPSSSKKRDLKFALSLKPGEQKQLKYELRPTERGEYHFGQLNAFVSGPIGLVMRRYRFSMDAMVPTYPSYLQMKQYQLMAVSNRLKDLGVKKSA